jgi:inhibitor of KinA
MLKKLNNIGDSAVLCDFGEEVNESTNKEVINLFNFIKKQSELEKIKGILNCTPSYNKLIVSFDLKKTNFKIVSDIINSAKLENLDFSKKQKKWNIPICYDFGIDIINITKKLGINKEEIIDIHSKSTYFIYMIGFVPGHPFMGDISSKLFLNRLKTPRVKVPPGSVGIVEKFCNIYPYESPGGWNIIGRTPIKLFSKENKLKPCLLSPGDTIKFKSISKKEFNAYAN